MLQIPPNIKQLIETVALALATCDKNNIPNVVAVACVKVVSPNQILITDNFFNKTRTNVIVTIKEVWDPREPKLICKQ